jgi:type I restriction enzyme S subunit
MRDLNKQWRMTTLGAHVDVQTGYPFRSQRYTDDPTGVRLLRGDNIVQGCLRWDGVKRWPSDNVKDYIKYFLVTGDVVVAMDRPWIEAGLKYAWISERDLPCMLVQRVARLRGTNGLRTSFLRYLIGHRAFTDYVKGIWTGVAVPHISESQIRAFPITLPPIAVQEQIVNILCAYDELIENNIRRVKVLEEMAQRICREWFVNFRFPGHERFKMVESEVGPIPMGWRAGLLREMCESIDYGHTASAVAEPIGPKFLRITDIVPDTIDWPSVPYCPQPDRSPQKYRLLEGDIVVARTGATTGYAKRLNKRHPESIFASYLVRLRLKSEHSNSMVGLLVESDDYKRFIRANLGGAAQPQANAQILSSKPVAIPPSKLQAEFSAIVEPWLDQKEILQIKNTILRQTRDLLLPKLISGEVSVENLETETVSQIA